MSANLPHCPLCFETKVRCIETKEPPYAVYTCSKCDLGFVHPLPSAALLATSYNDSYYEPWRSQHVRTRRHMWQRRIALLQSYSRHGRLLDVGSGDGAFAALAVAAGYSVEATEISLSGSSQINLQAPSVSVHIGELSNLEIPSAHFNIVTAWHSLEHMREPFIALQEIRRIIRSNGLLFIAVPNRRNWPMAILYRFLKRRSYPLFSLKTKEIHLYHFTVSSLRMALMKTGFAIDYIGWDRSMVEPSKMIVDAAAAIPHLLGGALMTEAILTIAHPSL